MTEQIASCISVTYATQDLALGCGNARPCAAYVV